MTRKLALILGVIMVAVGLASFVPGITTMGPDGMKYLFGLFLVGSAHNAVHIVSGLLLAASSRVGRWARPGLQTLAVIYALFTIIGFIVGSGGNVLGLFTINLADNFLNLLLTAVFVYFGFAARERQTVHGIEDVIVHN